MMYTYQCVIERVIDGDTVVVDIDLGFDVWLKGESVRLSGIDAPEVRTRDLDEKKRGLAAKEFLERLLPAGSKQTLISESFSRGKYGRIVGDFAGSATSSVIQELLANGHAVSY